MYTLLGESFLLANVPEDYSCLIKYIAPATVVVSASFRVDPTMHVMSAANEKA